MSVIHLCTYFIGELIVTKETKKEIQKNKNIYTYTKRPSLGELSIYFLFIGFHQ